MSWWRLQLLKLKLNSSSEVKRSEAIADLTKLGTGDVAELLVQSALADDSAKVRAAAARGLAEIGNDRSVKILLAALESDNLRETATDALAVMPSIIGMLLEAIQSADADTRSAMIRVLSRMGTPALEPLKAAKEKGNWVLRQAATEALQSLTITDVPPAAESPIATQKAVGAQTRTRPPADSFDRAVKALVSPDPDARREAVRDLKESGDTRGIKLLVGALQDASPVVRAEAVDALDALKWEPADAGKRALRAIAAGDFGGALDEGLAALRPLVAVVPNVPEPEQMDALAALRELVESHITDIEPADLRAVAEFSHLRDMAHDELHRRGMKA